MRARAAREQDLAASLASDLLELTKPRITLMVVLTTAVGFLLGEGFAGASRWAQFFHTLVGTALVAAGASALNQVLERNVDARMQRTADRPLPAGRLDPDAALLFGVALSLVGLLHLTLAVNLLTALLGAATLAGYVFVYTPLKRVSSLATLVGAVPGAVPPMMGWTAARGQLDAGAWALFGLLFFWQLPHFLAIAWVYRGDYARGGFPMLPVLDATGHRTARQMILYTAALLPVSLLPSALQLSGLAYFLSALALGLIFLGYCFAFALSHTNRAARRLVLASVIYLPAVLLMLVLDRLLR